MGLKISCVALSLIFLGCSGGGAGTGGAGTGATGTGATGTGATGTGGAENGGGGAGGEGGSFSVPALMDDDHEITLTSLADVEARRKILIDFLWGKPGMPSDRLPEAVDVDVQNPIQSVSMTNLTRVDRLVIGMDQGFKGEAYHFIPAKPNGRLVIVQQGHGYTLDLAGLGETIAALVGEGYGVLGGMMVCYTSFLCDGFPASSPHNYLIDNFKPPTGNVLKYFFEHLVVGLHYLKTQSEVGGFAPYHDFSMTGLSGGGWSSVLYPAIDPTITTSIPCSGSTPMFLRHCTGDNTGCIDGYKGDAEQMYFPLFKHIVGYLDLYTKAAAGPGRKQIQEQIRHDGCCNSEDQYYNAVPGQTWDQVVRGDEQEIQRFLGGNPDNGWYRLEIDETASHTHVISPTTLAQVILGELDGNRRPFAAASASTLYAKAPDGEVLSSNVPTWMDTNIALVGTPTIIESDGSTDVFLRDPSSSPMHFHTDGGGGWTLEQFPGTLAGDPAAIVSEEGDIDVVGVGGSTQLFHWSKPAGGHVTIEYTDPEPLVVGPPVLLSAAEGSLDVLVRRIDGGVQHIYKRGGVWASERSSEAQFRGFPSGAITPDGNLHMFARGLDDSLMEVVQPLAHDLLSLGPLAQSITKAAAMAGSPSAVVDPTTNDVMVVARTPSGDMNLLTFAPGSSGSGWAPKVIKRPAGSPPAKGTAGFTFSPIAVPGGLFARAQEGGAWFYSLQAGWAWQQGLIR